MNIKFFVCCIVFCFAFQFNKVVAEPWTDYDVADDILNRWSLDWDKENCQSFDKLMGYRANPRMKQDNPVGYFDPQLYVVHGTYMPFSSKCHQFGQKNSLISEGFCGYVYPAGSVCGRRQEIKEGGFWDSVSSGYQRDVLNNHYDQARVQAFKDGTGEFGPDPLISGKQEAFCAYYRFFGCGSVSSDCGGRNNYLIKCVRMPIPPKTPPLCDVIPVGYSFKLAYIKPDYNNGLNSFFRPAVKVIYSEAQKRCDDGEVVEIKDHCPDGSEGEFIGNTVENTIVLEASKENEIFPETVEETITMLGSSYKFILSVNLESVCVSYKNSSDSSDSELKFLGCLPRTPITDPSLEVTGSLGENPDLDDLYLEAFFHGSGRPTEDTVDAPEMSLLKLYGDNADERVAKYFGLTMSSMKTVWHPKDVEEEELDAKIVCKKDGENDGEEGAIIIADPSQKCDNLFDVEFIEGYQCVDGSYVENPTECNDGGEEATNVTLKKCQSDNLIPAFSDCYIGNIDYESDPDGENLCLRGMVYEVGNFYIEKDGNKTYFEETRPLLHPVKLEGGKIVDDNSGSRATYELRSIEQDVLDKASIDYRGVFSFAHDTNLLKYGDIPRGLYVYKRKEFVDSITGARTKYVMSSNRSQPFFPDERDVIIPTSPLTRNLCARIEETADKPPPNLETVEYDQASLYFSDDPREKVEQSSAHAGISVDIPVKYFDDVIYKRDSLDDGFDSPSEGIGTTTIIPSDKIHYTKNHEGDFIDLDSDVPESIKSGVSNYPTNKNKYRDLVLFEHSGGQKEQYDRYYLSRVVDVMIGDRSSSSEPGDGTQGRSPVYADYGFVGFIDKKLDLTGCSEIEFELWGSGAAGMGFTINGNPENNRTVHAKKDRKHLCKEGFSGESGGYFKGRLKLRRSSQNIIALMLGSTASTVRTITSSRGTNNRRNKTLEATPTALWLSENRQPFKLLAVADGGTSRGCYHSRPNEGVDLQLTVINDTFEGTSWDKPYAFLDEAAYGTTGLGLIELSFDSVHDKHRPSLYIRKKSFSATRDSVAWDNRRVFPLERRYVSGSSFCGSNYDDASLSTGIALTPPIEIFTEGNIDQYETLVPGVDLINTSSSYNKNIDTNYVGNWALAQIIAHTGNRVLFGHDNYNKVGLTHKIETSNKPNQHMCSYAKHIQDSWNSESFKGNKFMLMQMAKMLCYNFSSGGNGHWGDFDTDNDFLFDKDRPRAKDGDQHLMNSPSGKYVRGLGGGHLSTYDSTAWKNTWRASRGSGAYAKVKCLR